jgi:hypothetical protein
MDYSARLKRGHLNDLIAYLRTVKLVTKAQCEDTENKNPEQLEFYDQCLFYGSMVLEDNQNSTFPESK